MSDKSKSKREVCVSFRLTKDEYKQLQHLAEVLKISESATLRKLIKIFSS